MDYILSSLDLEKLTIKDVCEPCVESNIVEMTCPGRPVIMYSNARVSILIARDIRNWYLGEANN